MNDRRTERLILREWTDDEADARFLFDMYSRREVQRFIGRVPKVMTDPAEVTALLRRWTGLADGVLGVRAVTTLDGMRLGSVLLKHIPWSADAVELRDEIVEDVEIGWHFHPDVWGNGYASEAAAAVLAEASAAGLPRIVAVTHPANAASQRVCLRIGMRPRGRTTQYYDSLCELFEYRPA